MRARRLLGLLLLALLLAPVLGEPVLAATATYKGLICIGDVYEAIFNTTGSYVKLVNRSYTNYSGVVYPGDILNATNNFSLQRVYYTVSGTVSVARNAEVKANRTGIYVVDKGYYYTWEGTIEGGDVFEANETGIFKIQEGTLTIYFSEDFEGSGYENSWTITDNSYSAGSSPPYPDSNVPTPIPSGSECLTQKDERDPTDVTFTHTFATSLSFPCYLNASMYLWVWSGTPTNGYEEVIVVTDVVTIHYVVGVTCPSNSTTDVYFWVNKSYNAWVQIARDIYSDAQAAGFSPTSITAIKLHWYKNNLGVGYNATWDAIQLNYRVNPIVTFYVPKGASLYLYDGSGNLVKALSDSDNDGVITFDLYTPLSNAKVVVTRPDRDYMVVDVDPLSRVLVYNYTSGALLVNTTDNDGDGVVTFDLGYEGYQSLSFNVTYGGDWKLHVYVDDGYLFVDGSNVTSSVSGGWYNVSWLQPKSSVLEWARSGIVEVKGVPNMVVELYNASGALLGRWADSDWDAVVSFAPPVACINGSLAVSADVTTGSYVYTGLLYPGDAFYYRNGTVIRISKAYSTGLWFINFTWWRLVVYGPSSFTPELNATISAFNYSIYLVNPVNPMSGGVLISVPDKTIVVRLGSPVLVPSGEVRVPTVNPFNPYRIVSLPPPPGVLQFLEPGYGTAQGIIAAGMLLGIYLALSRGEEEDTAGGVALASALTIVVGLVLGSYQVVAVAAVALALSLAYAFARR